MSKLWYWLLLPALFLVACRSSQKAVYAPDKIVPSEKALLWKISGNGLSKPSWLYGTIHIIPKNELDFSDATIGALDKSKRITFEIDMKEMTNIGAQMSLMTKTFMSGGKTLRDLLPAEDYAFVRSKMDSAGLPPGMMERMKPMFISTMLESPEGGESPFGNQRMTSVEMELYRLARRRKMESDGLETTNYQLSIFDSIPYEVQARMLVESLRQTDSGSDTYAEMIRLYKDADISAMQSMIAGESLGVEQYEELLLQRRNRNWIPVMGRMMREKPTFFAVGAGHLGGENGVIALLRKAGYKVEPEI
ncbi:MAG: TraB/GumN family protein [Saprospiraceae bacterium]|nr:TraB/GumN family protein [Saprospiraceae bacterium]